MELKQGSGGTRTRRLLLKYFIPSQVINQQFIFQKNTMNIFVKRKNCAILSVTVWERVSLFYIYVIYWKAPLSIIEHQHLFLKRRHTCLTCKVLTKMRYCVGVIQDHNRNRMRNYSGKWVRPIFLVEGNVRLENWLRKPLL